MNGASEAVSLVALVGNPNAGKTTIFNALTGSNQRVGNFAGVTVEMKSGEFFTPHGRKMRVLDLPGCYSLESTTPDQRIAAQALRGDLPGMDRPDVVVCVVDASNLERHLRLAMQLIQEGLPTVVALNMVDVAEKAGLRLDVAKISEELGVPVVAMQASARKGIVDLKQALRMPFPAVPEISWNRDGGEQAQGEFIRRLCELAARRPGVHQQTVSDRIDAWALHLLWGWVVFALMMFAVFWAIFSFAAIPMGWIESLQGWIAERIESTLAEGDLRSLLVDGVLGGVGGVLVFLPQIVLLFFFIGLMESSGYMARAAYLMDGLMAKAGLSGKAFLPLFSAYACAIPGVMATRTIDCAKERLVTIFIAPWMSCSARLPVYFLIVPLLMGEAEGSWKQASVLFAIYVAGTMTAFVVARLLRNKLGSETGSHFILELPPYRMPQWPYIFRHVIERGGAFVAKAGTLILGLSILLWALGTYPKSEGDDADALAHSAMGRMGAFIEPVVEPLGFDGRVGTAILTSFAAREVFNSSMAVMFRVDEGEGDEKEARASLRERLADAKWPDGRPLFTPLAMISLLIFYIYALQCLPTSVVVAKESGSWKWAVGQFAFMSAFAYLASLTIYQFGRMMGF
ncbi:MAG: ferrous iron transport protein [Verrucomicrobiota bacterium]|jgi:ferrous iron transport protein B